MHTALDIEEIAHKSKTLYDVADVLNLWMFDNLTDTYMALWEIYKNDLLLLREICHVPIDAFNVLADKNVPSNSSSAFHIRKILMSLLPQCDDCGKAYWNDLPIHLELHHIDHDRMNNHITNVQLLCPNCHSFRKALTKPNVNKITDDELITALEQNGSIAAAYRSLGVKNFQASYYYKRAYKIAYENDIPIIIQRRKPNRRYEKSSNKQHKKSSSTSTNKRKEPTKRNSILEERIPRATLKKLLREKTIEELAQEYGTHTSSLGYLCIQYALPVNQSLIDLYTDEEWENENFIFGF